MQNLTVSVIFVVLVLISINAFLNAVEGNSDNTCRPINKTLTLCPAITNKLSLSCPAGHLLADVRSSAYRGHDLQCPDQVRGQVTCRVDNNQTTAMEDRVKLCERRRICADVELDIISDPDVCRGKGFNGVIYYAVSYRCEPQFSRFLNGSAWAVAMNEPATRSSSMINVNSLMSALMGNFVNFLDTYCSVHIPAGLDVIIRPVLFVLIPQNSKGQCVHVTDGDVEHRICSVKDSPIVIGCSDKGRRLSMRYVTNDSSVQAVFVIQVQVSHEFHITATCGLSLGNQFSDHIPKINPVPPKSVRTKENALGVTNMEFIVIIIACGFGGLILIVTAVCLIYCQVHKRRFFARPTPSSERSTRAESMSSDAGSPIDEDPKKNLVITYSYVDDDFNKV